MKKTVTFSCLLALSSMMAVGSAVFAAEGDVYRLRDDANLRSGPDSSYAAAAIVLKGDQVVELGSNNGWLKVRLNSGATGWLYDASLDAVAKAPALSPQPALISDTKKSGEVAELFVLNDTSEAVASEKPQDVVAETHKRSVIKQGQVA